VVPEFQKRSQAHIHNQSQIANESQPKFKIELQKRSRGAHFNN